MSWDAVAATVVAVLVFGAGLAGARWAGRFLMHRRARRRDELEHRGMLYDSDLIVRVALIIVWGGVALSSLALLPALVWIGTGDQEAGEVAVRMFFVCLPFAGIGVLMALAGSSTLVVESDRLTRAGPFGERSIRFTDIDRIDEARTLPALVVRGPGRSIRISRMIAGFDDLLNRLVAEVHPGALPKPRATGRSEDRAAVPSDGHYAVRKRTTYGAAAFFAVFLVFLVTWPWFAVTGEHPVRDSFIFTGMGIGLWLLIALLVKAETFPSKQPIELELRPTSIAWRTLRGSWEERQQIELVSASVETTIIYVKGQPGYRYPLRLRFTDGTVLEIGDQRGRQFGAPTQLIGGDVRGRYLDTRGRSPIDQTAGEAAFQEGLDAERAGDFVGAAEWYRRAIAFWPSDEYLILYRHIGELLRRHGTTDEHRESAVAHLRAHIDFHPADASAWQAIGDLLSGNYRTDLADDAIATAEQLLLSGNASSPSSPVSS